MTDSVATVIEVRIDALAPAPLATLGAAWAIRDSRMRPIRDHGASTR